MTQLVLLALIYDTPASKRSISSLSKAAGLGLMTVSRAADKFEYHGLARRRSDLNYGRVVLIEITAKGRRILEAAG